MPPLTEDQRCICVCFLVLATYRVPVSVPLRTEGEVRNLTSPALLSTTSQEETSQMPEKAWRLSVSNQTLFCTERNSTAATLRSSTRPSSPDLVASPGSRWCPACVFRTDRAPYPLPFLASTETKRMATTPDRQPRRA